MFYKLDLLRNVLLTVTVSPTCGDVGICLCCAEYSQIIVNYCHNIYTMGTGGGPVPVSSSLHCHMYW